MVKKRKSETVIEFLGTLEPGQVRQGVVTSIERFGVFVDLGGADGLVNAAELTWRHFDDWSEIVEVGQEVVVMVLDVDLDRERLSLSLKALQADPLVEIARTRLGDVVTGPVTRVVPFGAFVAVAEGVEGLIHVSHFPMGRLPAEGRSLTFRIREINLIHRRVRLDLVQVNGQRH
ncbi:small subunit ribosomal protein S1 [Sinosporangium album]|uniref:Small subunit ribosomal protein S1 n=1 Tax=Sinosporangium album TaxID=504805 RepID=A0A1G7SC41_9ACTN|nr:S1 RNA-binding domain-containing protein [Sinosporangium album]SDG20617.1 small subunit ribosomal protein S1 [Sinosporangium album]